MDGQGLDVNVLVAIFFGLLALYILVRILYIPLKIFLKLAGSAVVGAGFLFLFNLLGAIWGVQIGINVVTAFVVGLLGLPGVVLLFVLQYLTG